MKRITDGQGQFVKYPDDGQEPEPGSVILTDGELGNAWQRYASDGLWHRGKQANTWEQMLTFRNVLLVHDAPARDDAKILVLPANKDGGGSVVEGSISQIASANHVHNSDGLCLKRRGAPLCPPRVVGAAPGTANGQSIVWMGAETGRIDAERRADQAANGYDAEAYGR